MIAYNSLFELNAQLSLRFIAFLSCIVIRSPSNVKKKRNIFQSIHFALNFVLS